ncbi:MAG: trypsin-like peptidase domain-containing protein [Kofleriaceae bacterium]
MRDFRVTMPTPTPDSAQRDSAAVIKLLAVLLLLVAGALVYTVLQQRKLAAMAQPGVTAWEPRAVTPLPASLGADETSTIEVFRQSSPSVVHITNLKAARNRLTLAVDEIPQGTGTGFVWDTAGHVITNFHVVQGADHAQVTLEDGSDYAGEIVGTAPDKDLAVIKIDAPPSKLRPLAVGTSGDLVVGQKVLAIGNPFGLDQTLTTGVISGLGRQIQSITKRPINDVIQTDASINPGNSGGPLLDSSGRLIGVNTAIYSPTGANAGIGFAVPVDTINRIVPQIIKHGDVPRPGLGVTIAQDSVAARLGLTGVLIIDVVPGGAAAAAGLVGTRQLPGGKWSPGDVIVAIDGSAIANTSDLYRSLDDHKVGDQVTVTVQGAGGARRDVSLSLQAIK